MREAGKELTKMIEAFPNYDKGTIEKKLANYIESCVQEQISERAIIQTARRFKNGNVNKQSTTRPPTIPEFMKDALERKDLLEVRERFEKNPRISAPDAFIRSGPAPFEVYRTKVDEEFRGWTLLRENCDLNTFNKLARTGDFPVGARWAIGRVYAPRSTEQ